MVGVDRGDHVSAGQPLYAHTWQPEERPEGWAGGVGQYHVPDGGDMGRFFSERSKDGTLKLLGPNGYAGFETLAARSSRSARRPATRSSTC